MTPDGEREVIIVGGGPAGLSAAIYLGRALRQTLVVDAGHSMAVWEPEIENYLGFPQPIAGRALLERGRRQAERYGVAFTGDEITAATRRQGAFELTGRNGGYRAQKLLLATGIRHVPPEVPGVPECLGKSLFFCKDCDAYRVRGQRVAIIGANDETADYALGMLSYCTAVLIATNGRAPLWDRQRARWIREYGVPLVQARITNLVHVEGQVERLQFADGSQVLLDGVFATRGDVYHNELAVGLGARVDREGQVVVDAEMRTSVPGLYAAGCVTPANCQLIVSAGNGAIAAQAINRDLFDEALSHHRLPHCGGRQAA